MSMSLLKMGGYKMVSHIVAELRMERRPNKRNKTEGDAVTSASTIPLDKPAGAIAGARAMKTLIWLLSLGWMAKLAKA
jgi:hypothetical protein